MRIGARPCTRKVRALDSPRLPTSPSYRHQSLSGSPPEPSTPSAVVGCSRFRRSSDAITPLAGVTQTPMVPLSQSGALRRYPLRLRVEKGDAATAPLSVTPLARAQPVAYVANQIDADYAQLLQATTQAALSATSLAALNPLAESFWRSHGLAPGLPFAPGGCTNSNPI